MNDGSAPHPYLAAASEPNNSSRSSEAEPWYTIGELAKKFQLSPRTLRFYESRRLLTPRRQGRRRLYGRKDVERLEVILKAKRLGLALSEIRQIISGEGSQPTLELSREKCLAQIAILERKLAEIQEALAELRSMYGLR